MNYKLFKPQSEESPLILTSVHSGDRYTDLFLKKIKSFQDDYKSIEDMFMNQIVSGLNLPNIHILISLYSRLILDLNRSEKELDIDLILDPKNFEYINTPRVKGGIGLIPKNTPKKEIDYINKYSEEEIRVLIDNFYQNWHNKLNEIINKVREYNGFAFILDCHSMPSHNPYVGKNKLSDIVLGDNHNSTCPKEIIDIMTNSITKEGFTVSINEPYAGGFITQNYFNAEKKIFTLQIEIKRDLYMDEKRYLKNDNFNNFKNNFRKIINDLNDFLINRYKVDIAAE